MFTITLSAFLFSIILFLLFKLKKQHEVHNNKINFLQEIIGNLLQMQKNQEIKVKLSDELIQNLHKARKNIDQNILSLQKEIIEKLATNNLLD